MTTRIISAMIANQTSSAQVRAVRRMAMLTRVYIDNYKCYTNFELSLDRLSLLFGLNGAGKSSFLEALAKLQAFLGGVRAEGVFFISDLTRWTTLKTHRFELDVTGKDGKYRYELGVQFGEDDDQSVGLEYERLWFENKPLLQFEAGNVKLYRDDFSLDASYPLDRSQSAVALVPFRRENERINWFRRHIYQILIVQFVPPLMGSESERESSILTLKSENFASWYRSVSKDQGLVARLTQQLQQVLPGFSHFVWRSFSEQRQALLARFVAENDKRVTFEYALHQLSDGQRMLVGLYTVLVFGESTGQMLCIDEPENFLALPEIQPWLNQLYDLSSAGAFQSILISHHPELIDFLASSHGIWFGREASGPVRVKQIGAEDNEGLPISELFARGWIDA